MRGTPRRHILLMVSAAFTLGTAGAAAAQVTGPTARPARSETLDTLVVTAPRYVPDTTTLATKVATPLIEAPQSVTVINRDQIDLLNWQNLGQAVRYTAGIVGENFGSDERFDWLTLRGFNPVQYIDGLQAPVGSVSNTGLDLYGAQSVEILKGPASVLYGLAPPGGIVNMTSRRPEAKFGGEAQVLYGSYADRQAAADVTGPVNDNLDLRLTTLYRDRGTQVDGVSSKRFYIAPAATIHLDPKTDLWLLSYYQWDEVRGDGGGFFPPAGIYSPNPVGPITSSMNLGDFAYNRFVRRQYGVGYDFRHEFGGNLTFEQNLKYFDSYGRMLDVFGAGLATTTTNGPGLFPYLNPLTGVQETDSSGAPLYSNYRTVKRSNFPFTEAIHSFNVDSRLTDRFETGPVEHTTLVGLDYRRYILQSQFGFSAAPPIDLFNPNHNQAITTPTFSPFTNQTETQVGLYAQDAMKLGGWVFTVGGRQDWVNSKNSNVPQDHENFSYRVGLNYVFPSGLAPYVAYATSFQPTPGSDFQGRAFKPTSGDQVEAGVKFEPWFAPRDVNILATLAVYDLKQDNVLEADPNTVLDPFGQIQIGHVEVKGVEFETVARINERLSLIASYSYTESEVNAGPGQPLSHLTLTPKNKVSAFADYTIQTGTFAGLGFGLGYRFISSTYGDAANQWIDPAYGLFDAVLHYDIKTWRLSVDASNLFDKQYISQCSSESHCFYGLRRNVVATVTRRF
jgi:iron complex outermembrane recepter protein